MQMLLFPSLAEFTSHSKVINTTSFPVPTNASATVSRAFLLQNASYPQLKRETENNTTP